MAERTTSQILQSWIESAGDQGSVIAAKVQELAGEGGEFTLEQATALKDWSLEQGGAIASGGAEFFNALTSDPGKIWEETKDFFTEEDSWFNRTRKSLGQGISETAGNVVKSLPFLAGGALGAAATWFLASSITGAESLWSLNGIFTGLCAIGIGTLVVPLAAVTAQNWWWGEEGVQPRGAEVAQERERVVAANTPAIATQRDLAAVAAAAEVTAPRMASAEAVEIANPAIRGSAASRAVV